MRKKILSIEEIVDEMYRLIMRDWSVKEKRHFFLNEWTDDEVKSTFTRMDVHIRAKYDLNSRYPKETDTIGIGIIQAIWKKGFKND